MEYSYQCCTSDLSDVRELTPEFYCCPEILLNQNNLQMGKTQEGVLVNDVELPEWCQGDPYRYVVQLRRAFESDYVSQNLQHWLDLIFGYRQTGREAEKALNVFYYLTYEDKVDWDAIRDEKLRIGTEAQIINYGQTPQQLFVQPHPTRGQREAILNGKLVAERDLNLKVYRPTSKKKVKREKDQDLRVSYNSLSDQAILQIQWITEQRFMTIQKGGTVQLFK